METRFKSRSDAGKKLAVLLERYKNLNVALYALPRGGVVVAKEISKKYHWPINLIIVRKIGHPLDTEFAIGAITSGGGSVFDQEILPGIDQDYLQKKLSEEQKEVKRRQKVYLRGQKNITPRGKIAIIIDDGLATGLTMMAAVKEIEKSKPEKIVVAVPVSPKETRQKIKKLVDDFIAVHVPEIFYGAIGEYYQNFNQTSDSEVLETMKNKI